MFSRDSSRLKFTQMTLFLIFVFVIEQYREQTENTSQRPLTVAYKMILQLAEPANKH